MCDSGQVYGFSLGSVLNEEKCTVNEADFMSVQWTFIFKFHNVRCSVISLLLECRSAEECAGVCVCFPLSHPFSPCASPPLSALLNVQAGMSSFPTGWPKSDNSLAYSPCRKPIPLRQIAAHLRMCVCVSVCLPIMPLSNTT